MTDETWCYNCGLGMGVEVTLPKDQHTEYFRNTLKYIYQGYNKCDADFLTNLEMITKSVR